MNKNMSTTFFSSFFIKRLPTVDLEQLNREQLVKIFKSYATPIHKRFKYSHTTNHEDQIHQLHGTQQNVQLKTKPETNVERLTDACKRIKFSNTREEELISKKRPHDGDTQMVINSYIESFSFYRRRLYFRNYLHNLILFVCNSIFFIQCRYVINHPVNRRGRKLHGHDDTN